MIIVLWVFARTCRRRLSYYQVLLGKYLHLQYNVFVIYEDSKAVPQRPSHDKVPQKHVADWQGSTSTEAWFQQSCCYASLLMSHFDTDPPAPRRPAAYSLKHSWNGTPPRGCFRCIYNTLIVNIRNLHLMWQNPVAVFKNTLIYWHK